MVCCVKTAALSGIMAQVVEVQVSVTSGLPAFVIVGLPDKAVNESRERVRAVFTALGVEFPHGRIIVNLTPADLLKDGTHYDLPIALGLLAAMGAVDENKLKDYLFMGALGLGGVVEAVAGVLPAAVLATGKELGLVCPFENGGEATWSGNGLILPVEHILQLLNYLREQQPLIRRKSRQSAGKITQLIWPT